MDCFEDSMCSTNRCVASPTLMICSAGNNGDYCDTKRYVDVSCFCFLSLSSIEPTQSDRHSIHVSTSDCNSNYCNLSTRKCEASSLLANGATCSASSQCLSGHCVLGSDGTKCRSGLVGSWCDLNSDCETGYCNTTTRFCELRPLSFVCSSDSQCASTNCAPGPDGTLCRSGSLGAYCDSNNDCSSLFCSFSGSYGTCSTNLLSNGQTCTQDNQCVSNMCVYGLCSGGFAGNVCEVNGDCLSNTCTANKCYNTVGMTCTIDGDCVTSKCASFSGVRKCSAGNVGDACDGASDCLSGVCGATGICEGLLAEGATCTADYDCKSGMCITGSDGTKCRTGKTWDPCTKDKQCSTGYCQPGSTLNPPSPYGACRPNLSVGSTCLVDSNCQSNKCVEGSDGTKCRNGNNGSPCDGNYHCGSGRCDLSKTYGLCY